ncbi:unnamed protein product [Staurois parvus]|uniref:Uncharacterized protein n=1 Tax=Staurois parvus TaxID=386267 RepID=A0ABN9E0P8_9NEOB|nr:unnamed protein product [Staurois parvus]
MLYPCRNSRPRLSITGSRPVITCWCPVIAKHLRWGRELFVNKTVLPPDRSCTLLCMAQSAVFPAAHTPAP